MSTEFDRPMFGFRFVETHFGDTLQAVAARELGDAARWTEIIAYNNLVPPFITDDPAQAGPGVVLTGATVLVPAPSPVVSSTLDPDAVFEVDVQLGQGGRLMTADGDFMVVAGRANLRQALKHCIETEAGELIYHTEYGSRIRQLVGAINGPTAALLAAERAKLAVLNDDRISRVDRAVATVDGDVVRVEVDAVPVTGKTLQVAAAA